MLILQIGRPEWTACRVAEFACDASAKFHQVRWTSFVAAQTDENFYKFR